MLTGLVVLAVALSPVQSYNLGNRLYAQKDYEGAVRAYEEALRAGPSAAAEYNLGNAQFKAGRVGRAILAYRRARALDPRDGDISANLAFARSYRQDKLPSGGSPLGRILDRAFRWLSIREATLAAAIGFTLAGLFFAAWIVGRWSPLAIAGTVCALAAAYGLVGQRVWSAERDARPAVVVVPEVHALGAPSEDAKEILLLHDGTEVRIREMRDDYVLVQIPGGNGGWIPRSAVERVYRTLRG